MRDVVNESDNVMFALIVSFNLLFGNYIAATALDEGTTSRSQATSKPV